MQADADLSTKAGLVVLDMYLLDTNILSDLMKRAPSTVLTSKVNQVPAEEQLTSSITLGELFFGARKKKSERMLLEVRRVVEHFVVVPFDTAAAELYGEIRAFLEGDGLPIGEPDTQIAAIALARDLTVVTANVDHFGRVPGLKMENWLRP